MHMHWRWVAILGLVAAALVPVPGQAAEAPRRIVSLDLCTDQLLIDLVERERIAAVTHLAADPEVSAIWEKGKGIPITRGKAEDVLHYKPDLILAGPFGVAPTREPLPSNASDAISRLVRDRRK